MNRSQGCGPVQSERAPVVPRGTCSAIAASRALRPAERRVPVADPHLPLAGSQAAGTMA